MARNTFEDVEKAELVIDDQGIKRSYLSKIYFLLGLHFTVISAVSFCLFMIPGVRPFIQQHAYLVPFFLALFLLALIVNRLVLMEFGPSILLFVILTLATTLAYSAVALYLDTENGFLISGIIALSWFFHSMMSALACVRLNLLASMILTPLFLVAGSLILIEVIGLFSFNIFVNAPISFFIMIYILYVFHTEKRNYSEDTLIAFREVYPNIIYFRPKL